MLFLFFCFIFLFVLRIEQALAFAFTNVGPITILQLARVSWTLDPSDDQSEIRLLVLAANGTAHETIGNFFSMNEYIFNVTDGGLRLGNYSWFIYGGTTDAPQFVSPKFDVLAAGTLPPFSSSASAPGTSSSPSSTVGASPTPSPRTSDFPGGSTSLPTEKKNPKTVLIVGLVIGILVFPSLIALTLLFLRRRRKRAAARHRLSMLEDSESRAAARIDVFPTSTSQSRSASSSSNVGKAARRQAHLAQQMQAIRAEMDELSRLPSTSSRPASVSPNEDGRTPGSGEGVTAESHTAEQFAALQARIRELEAQVRSQFALGLSDEAPPGYAVLKAMGRLNFRAEFGPQP
ncbi:hypothetical protein MVEN_02328600 [Mycena venus]|uniref:Mid2 domain-containing protein n=1 Tax=Mycena venus TaxID=2733690 RepID=A0A8H6X3F0_9AGAR|nr:hypothetical protein MVEN_02328600 [Mycena venus]